MEVIIKEKLRNYTIHKIKNEIKTQHEWIISIIHNVEDKLISRKLQSIESNSYRFSRVITIKEGENFKSMLFLKGKVPIKRNKNKDTKTSVSRKDATTSASKSEQRRVDKTSSTLDTILNTVSQIVEKNKELSKKFSNTYFTHKNVENYNSSEIKTWCSKKKQNVWFAIMRIKNSKKRDAAAKNSQPIKQRPTTEVAKITSTTTDVRTYSVVPPPISYDMSDSFKISSLKKLFGNEMDKVMLLTCLKHLAVCERGNLKHLSSRLECVRVANYCRSRNIIDLPSRENLIGVVDEAMKLYRVTDDIISCFRNSPDWINHSKSFSSNNDNLTESTFCYKV